MSVFYKYRPIFYLWRSEKKRLEDKLNEIKKKPHEVYLLRYQ